MESVVYGKYIPKIEDRLVTGLSDQTMNVFKIKNPKNGEKYPLVIEIHGGGFMVKKKSNSIPKELKDVECVFASFEYRRVNKYYKHIDTEKEERGIVVKNDNSLEESEESLYNPEYIENYNNRTNFALKCIFDCTLQMDYLIDNAEKYNIDLQNVHFFGSSAGTLMCNYLTYVYSKLKGYKVVSIALDNAQLNYSVESTSSQVFSLFQDEYGDAELPSESEKIFGMEWSKVCETFQNPQCSNDENEVNEICVNTHEDYISSTYCNNNNNFKLSDLSNDPKLLLTMPFSNIKRLILESSVTQEFCYVSYRMKDIPHNGVYALQYLKIFKEKNIKNYYIRSGSKKYGKGPVEYMYTN